MLSLVLITGRTGRCQRDAEARAVGHSTEEDEAGGFAAALPRRLLQSRASVSVLAALAIAAMAVGRLTKAYNSAFWAEHHDDPVHDRVAGAACAAEPRARRAAHRE